MLKLIGAQTNFTASLALQNEESQNFVYKKERNLFSKFLGLFKNKTK